MGRVNKTISGVFIDIVGTPNQISQYQQFINRGSVESSKVNEFLSQYTELVSKHKATFEELAALEEIIIQMRIKDDLNDIKLSLVREYIYARTPFYRKSNTAKDIRVIVDKLDFHPEGREDLTNLFGKEEFMKRAKEKLIEAMSNEIISNINELKLLQK